MAACSSPQPSSKIMLPAALTTMQESPPAVLWILGALHITVLVTYLSQPFLKDGHCCTNQSVWSCWVHLTEVVSSHSNRPEHVSRSLSQEADVADGFEDIPVHNGWGTVAGCEGTFYSKQILRVVLLDSWSVVFIFLNRCLSLPPIVEIRIMIFCTKATSRFFCVWRYWACLYYLDLTMHQ